MPVSVLAEPCSGLDVDVADEADDGFDTDAVVEAVAEDDVVPAEPPPPPLPPLPPPGTEVRKTTRGFQYNNSSASYSKSLKQESHVQPYNILENMEMIEEGIFILCVGYLHCYPLHHFHCQLPWPS